MEARIGGNGHHFYGPVVSDLKAVGKRSLEWDLNDWKWDGDLFTAAPLNAFPTDCRSRQLFPVGSKVQADTGVSNSSSSCSEENNVGVENGKQESEKRRRVVVIDDEEFCDEDGSLNLKLGGQVFPLTEVEKSGKKSKVAGTSSNRIVCQVDDCRADLRNAKDYHRRHKVCEMHSKATKALVGNVMQRFCQQCSRFHALPEFDEGKRSCRRRLAGHNKRRRKTHPENAINGVPLNDERGSSYLLVSLLRILSNIHSNSSENINDKELLSHLLKNLSGAAGSVNERNICGLLAGSQDLQTAGTSSADQEKEPQQPSRPGVNPSESEMIQMAKSPDSAQGGFVQTPYASQSTLPLAARESISTQSNALESTVGRIKMNNFDLNSAYDDSQECMETIEGFDAPINQENVAACYPSWLRQHPQKSSPPYTSGNSGSTSTHSPSSSSGEAQSRTDRIVFKLFGKDPNDFPLALRKQILDWLSNTPTDIEGYIRPGCIVLTVYLRMENSSWDNLCYDLSGSLMKLLDASMDSFWRTGWVYTRVLNHVAFVYDGQIVLNTLLPHHRDEKSMIVSIKPVAVSVSVRTQFSVRGFNLSRSSARLLCALEGSYLVQGSCADAAEGMVSSIKLEDDHSLSFSCDIPNFFGRGFIEIEDDSLSSSFLPFIVAEQDVCLEICTLESEIEVAETADDQQREAGKLEAREQALSFINEMSWLLHRSNLKFRLASMDPNVDMFSFKRFKWLMEFSIDHDWCAVVKKLLGLIYSGTVDLGDHPSIELALLEIGLLHRAVRRNCRIMIESLLNYYPESTMDDSQSEKKVLPLFRPDAAGPGGLTPLHVAASRDGSENVLDALTNDSQLVGIKAWRTARDSTGLTPNDYASLRGHFSYIHLVQRKLNKRLSTSEHVIVDIPPKVASFGTEKNASKLKPVHKHCKQCEQKLGYSSYRSSVAIYRPAMLSLVAIAAVCVCVALLFKSLPEVDYVLQPFCWERLQYGAS